MNIETIFLGITMLPFAYYLYTVDQRLKTLRDKLFAHQRGITTLNEKLENITNPMVTVLTKGGETTSFRVNDLVGIAKDSLRGVKPARKIIETLDVRSLNAALKKAVA